MTKLQNGTEISAEPNVETRLHSSVVALPVWARLIRHCTRTLPGFYPGAPKRNVIVLLAYLLVGLVVFSLLWSTVVG
ncbi:hypothetical protein AArcCO_1178 [Halalkaliarchaeum sp. AArc-CO]|uniref:hypothetical protein n=1 Tax=Halalkaliarchaeum sp. AArc-CO TaxID=2866381 RepID=UPI00217EEF08|nr:hypothetical protein [Halalkaliarchaeum sp. AArc-CO]UWG50488.1 hypothetical protein AArcCO_1178 [Halalkaliarchaeum sp. AArc-CO]